MNTKLHAVTDAIGRPVSFFITAGQVSDYTSAAALLTLGIPRTLYLSRFPRGFQSRALPCQLTAGLLFQAPHMRRCREGGRCVRRGKIVDAIGIKYLFDSITPPFVALSDL